MEKKSDLKVTATNAFKWAFLGKMLKNGGTFIISIFLARILDPRDFGLIAIVTVFTGLANVFSDMGLSGAIIQRKRLLKIHIDSVFFFNLSISILCTTITFLLAPYIADYYDEKQLLILTRVLSFTFVLNAFSTMQNALLKKEINFKKSSQLQLIATLISGLTALALAYFGFGIWSLVYGLIMDTLIYSVIIWKVSDYKPSLQFSFKALKSLWGFGFRMFLSKLLDSLFNQIDYLVTGKVMNLNILGFYQRSKSLSSLVHRYSSESIIYVMFPILSKIQHNKKLFYQKIFNIYKIILIVSFFISGCLFIVADDLIVFIYGEKWIQTVPIFKIMILGGVILPINGLFSTILSSTGMSKEYLRLEILKKISFSLPIIVFIFSKDLEMFLYGNLLIGFLLIIFSIYYIWVYTQVKMRLFLNPFLKSLAVFILTIFLAQKFLVYSFDYRIIDIIYKSICFFIIYFTFSYTMKLDGLILIIDKIKLINPKKLF